MAANLDFAKLEELKENCHPIRVAQNPAVNLLSKAKQVLLLQGPVGPFFDRLAAWLQKNGAKVHRVVFQGGDKHDCKLLAPIAYKGTLEDWPLYLSELVKRLNIDCMVVFGQSRRYHERAKNYAIEAGLPLVVCEEGYFRPGFITMELGGVNGYSNTMNRFVWRRSGIVSNGLPVLPQGTVQPDVVPWHFQHMAWYAAMHYWAMSRLKSEFPNYIHHRNKSPKYYARYWLRSWRNKFWFSVIDYRFQAKLFASHQSYFFVPLQHDGDAQIEHHSNFGQNTNFIIEVMRSFAQHAPENTWLIFRQHPHSRGGAGHGQLIRGLADDVHIGHRVHLMTEGDTPDLAEHAAGVVLINSTVGLQTIERGAPLMVMGEALYKKEGLTFGGSLDAFWTHARAPHKAEAIAFLFQIKNLTQAPASVYASFTRPLRWN